MSQSEAQQVADERRHTGALGPDWTYTAEYSDENQTWIVVSINPTTRTRLEKWSK